MRHNNKDGMRECKEKMEGRFSHEQSQDELFS